MEAAYQRRTERLEAFYHARTVTWAQVQPIVDCLLFAVRLHCSPEVTAAIEQEFARILAQFTTTSTERKEGAQ